MRSKVLVILSAVLLFGLSIAVYAYSSGAATEAAATSCCCKGDSCPMKTGDSKAAKSEAKTEGAGSCCCAGDSCAMKSSGEKSAEGASSCCCSGGGDSCPMKSVKTADHAAHGEMKHDAKSADAASCCKVGAGKKAEDKTDHALHAKSADGKAAHSCCCSKAKENKETE